MPTHPLDNPKNEKKKKNKKNQLLLLLLLALLVQLLKIILPQFKTTFIPLISIKSFRFANYLHIHLTQIGYSPTIANSQREYNLLLAFLTISIRLIDSDQSSI